MKLAEKLLNLLKTFENNDVYDFDDKCYDNNEGKQLCLKKLSSYNTEDQTCLESTFLKEHLKKSIPMEYIILLEKKLKALPSYSKVKTNKKESTNLENLIKEVESNNENKLSFSPLHNFKINKTKTTYFYGRLKLKSTPSSVRLVVSAAVIPHENTTYMFLTPVSFLDKNMGDDYEDYREAPIVDQNEKISERLISLCERLGVRGTVTKHGLLYFFGTGRYPNAIAYRDNFKGLYNIMFLKKQGYIHPMAFGSENLKDEIGAAKENFLHWKRIALDKKVLKKDELNLTPSDFLKLMVNKESVNPYYLFKAFPELQVEEQENKAKIENFEFMYQNEKELPQVEAILKETTKVLTKFGFKKLLYGKVYSTPNLGSGRIADYTMNTDAINISNKARKSDTATKTMIHELGHRLWYKFLNSSQQKIIVDKYLEVIKGKDIEISKGDKFRDKDGKELVIIDYDFSQRKSPYIFSYVDDSKSKYKASKGYFRYMTPLDKDFVRNNFDVSDYARTNEKEFFSEVFAWGLLGKDKEIQDWISQFK